ncbi:MAG: glycosyltransferase [Candidatus Magasanikbacteria bacterium]
MQFPQILTLIIPVYNGEQYIEKTCNELHTFCVQNNFIDTIVFVDDGSTDETRKRMEDYTQNKSFKFKILGYRENKGKGHAIKFAFEHVHPNGLVAFTDVELPYGLEVLKDSMMLLQDKEIGMIVGNRHIVKTLHPQYNRYRGFFTKIFHLILPREVRAYEDTQCGLKIFTREAAHILFSNIKTYRWVFDVELFIIAIRNNVDILQIPVALKQPCNTRGGVSALRHGLQIIKDVITIYRNDKQGVYERN